MLAAIEFEAISKRYESDKQVVNALDSIDLRVEEGEFFGLLGPNGAGKTTLINILAGLLHASSGTASVLGHDVVRDYAQARRNLGVVPQELVFDPFFNVREALKFQSGYFGLRHNDAWIDELLHGVGLEDKADTNLRRLSGGMKRRVLVAQALVHQPRVIVLDEPTAGVDVELRQSLWRFIAQLNKKGHTILLTTHYLEEAESLCNRVAMLKQGRVVALERTSELLKNATASLLCFKTDAVLPEALRKQAQVTGRTVQLPVQGALEIEACLTALRAADVPIEDVEIGRADLEDVFLEVMRKGNS